MLKEIDNLNEQNYSIDEKLSKQIEGAILGVSNQIYVDNLFMKAQLEEHGRSIQEVTDMVT